MYSNSKLTFLKKKKKKKRNKQTKNKIWRSKFQTLNLNQIFVTDHRLCFILLFDYLKDKLEESELERFTRGEVVNKIA